MGPTFHLPCDSFLGASDLAPRIALEVDGESHVSTSPSLFRGVEVDEFLGGGGGGCLAVALDKACDDDDASPDRVDNCDADVVDMPPDSVLFSVKMERLSLLPRFQGITCPSSSFPPWPFYCIQ